ncbi:hypothetical protein [Taibaiella koreensis]|uniref:hypothetical protein n=1 Tax=Taibaiella koreensis TaxID=1268548 RepID=UPI000E59D70E|nr:hypothetical protein [Taibaiella koreensis]
MAKVKINGKRIEGDVDAINTLFQQNSCNLAAYIGAAKNAPKHTAAYTITCIVAFLVVASLVWINALPLVIHKILVLLLFSLCFIITYLMHTLRKGHLATTIAFVGALAITLIALNVRTPQQVAKTIEETTQKHFNPQP